MIKIEMFDDYFIAKGKVSMDASTELYEAFCDAIKEAVAETISAEHYYLETVDSDIGVEFEVVFVKYD